jgi:hypothetical protein
VTDTAAEKTDPMKPFAPLALIVACLLAPPAAAQSAEESAFVIALMRGMNQLSVRFDREVCGYILRDATGVYSSTKVSWGGAASCASLPLGPGVPVVSSWHTHAAWAEGYDGEVPSIQDVEGDMRMGMNGWVATPGGRLWFVEGRTGQLRQVCGRGCLPVDPGFVPEEHGPVPEALSIDGLYGRFGRSR